MVRPKDDDDPLSQIDGLPESTCFYASFSEAVVVPKLSILCFALIKVFQHLVIRQRIFYIVLHHQKNIESPNQTLSILRISSGLSML